MTLQPGEMRKMDKIREYLLRDIGNEMESGRAMYLVRVTLLGELVYFALFSVVLPAVEGIGASAIMFRDFADHLPRNLS